MTIEELINRVFSTRDAVHLTHWTTKSYAEHQALGEFYEEVIDRLDTLVEAYMGYFGVIGTVGLKQIEYQNFLEFIGDEAKLICEHRSEIARNTPAIENLVDNLAEVYFKTFYKLANLK